MNNQNWTRKTFLKTSLAMGGAALLSRSRAFSTPSAGSANGDIRLAVIGCGPGHRGGAHIKWFGAVPGVRIVAVCDVDPERLAGSVKLAEAKGGKVKAYRDFRKLLEDPEIDGVTIATPHHWH